MEKRILPSVFCSSIVAVLAAAFVFPLIKVTTFIRGYSSFTEANASDGLSGSNSVQCRNFRRRNVCVRSPQPKRKNTYRGVSLIEVLVTLVVLSVGLLGMAAMQVRAMQMNQGAYMRSQAVSLSQDMADRMRINWQAAENGDYNLALAADTNACTPLGGSAGCLLAKNDIGEWRAFIQTGLPSVKSSIINNGDRFTITLCWDDSRGQGARLSNAVCGVDGLEFNQIEVML